ncbi:hypothetical protein BVIET440_220113 [Burkholderia vietnamiensis]|nr:hypothetical protein BVI2075_1100034 [Burkholderia vietnamiensis]CAG9231784.1 hypothetical protein BVI1335_80035 [Burkholderia vietnamiensis]
MMCCLVKPRSSEAARQAKRPGEWSAQETLVPVMRLSITFG